MTQSHANTHKSASYMHACIHTCIDTYKHRAYIHTHIHTYILTYIHVFIHTANLYELERWCEQKIRVLHALMYTHPHTYTHTHTHTYMHTYIHTHIHTYRHTDIHILVHAAKFHELERRREQKIRERDEASGTPNYVKRDLQLPIMSKETHYVKRDPFCQKRPILSKGSETKPRVRQMMSKEMYVYAKGYLCVGKATHKRDTLTPDRTACIPNNVKRDLYVSKETQYVNRGLLCQKRPTHS